MSSALNIKAYLMIWQRRKQDYSSGNHEYQETDSINSIQSSREVSSLCTCILYKLKTDSVIYLQ